MRARSQQASSVRKRAGESRCRVIVRERSEGMCEICNRRAEEMAHRVIRQMCGWRASNILHLCHQCHAAQRDNDDGYRLARLLGQTLYPYTEGVLTDPEREPVQTRYGRVFLLDDGTVTEVAS